MKRWAIFLFFYASSISPRLYNGERGENVNVRVIISFAVAAAAQRLFLHHWVPLWFRDILLANAAKI